MPSRMAAWNVGQLSPCAAEVNLCCRGDAGGRAIGPGYGWNDGHAMRVRWRITGRARSRAGGNRDAGYGAADGESVRPTTGRYRYPEPGHPSAGPADALPPARFLSAKSTTPSVPVPLPPAPPHWRNAACPAPMAASRKRVSATTRPAGHQRPARQPLFPPRGADEQHEDRRDWTQVPIYSDR